MRYLLIFATTLFLFSCSNEDTSEVDALITSSDYFPLEIGHSTSYQVTEVIYAEGQVAAANVSYQLKEEIVQSFIDDSGTSVYVVDRSLREDASKNWSYQESWYATINENQAIRIEDNKRFIKLKLPIEDGMRWNGNALFDATEPIKIGGDPIDYFKNWSSELIEYDAVKTIGNQTYQGVHTVSLADHENRLELRYGREMYAEDMGLIYREIRVLDTQCFEDCDNLTWEEKAESGHIYIQTILN